MRQHEESHSPILGDEWEWCSVCRAARNATFAQLRKIVPGLGPYDTDEFIARMKALADTHVRVLVGVYDWQERGEL